MAPAEGSGGTNPPKTLSITWRRASVVNSLNSHTRPCQGGRSQPPSAARVETRPLCLSRQRWEGGQHPKRESLSFSTNSRENRAGAGGVHLCLGRGTCLEPPVLPPTTSVGVGGASDTVKCRAKFRSWSDRHLSGDTWASGSGEGARTHPWSVLGVSPLMRGKGLRRKEQTV